MSDADFLPRAIATRALCWLPVRSASTCELLGFLSMPVESAEVGNVIRVKCGMTFATAPIGITPTLGGNVREAAVCAAGSQDREFWRSVEGFIEARLPPHKRLAMPSLSDGLDA